MKTFKFLSVVLLLSLSIVSCQKDEKIITHFTAGMERPFSKIYLDGVHLNWNSGDEVMVYSDGTAGSVFVATPRTENASCADLAGSIVEGSCYTAVYPACISAGAASVTLPVTQVSADGGLVGFPMYARTTTRGFQFKNLCGALKITLQQNDVTISRIQITANSNINGTYTIDATGSAPMLTGCTDGTATTTLNLTNPQSVAEGHDFYIYLPAGSYDGLHITFYQPDGSSCSMVGSTVVERSACTPIAVDMLRFDNPDLLSGIYSVSETRTVRFARGNLVATTIGGEPGPANTVWSFHQHQYDMLGNRNSVTGICDLFGWSTASTYYGLNTSTYESDYSGDFVDWGTAFGPDSPWRTLTCDDGYGEWYYLLFTRAASTVNGTSDARFAQIRVYDGANFINGVLLFPDVFVWPMAAGAAPARINIDDVGSSWEEYPYYTLSQFSALENAGCVFLPAAGYRYGTIPYYVGDYGLCWTSSLLGGGGAYTFDYFYYCVNPGAEQFRYYGLSVRLVQDN